MQRSWVLVWIFFFQAECQCQRCPTTWNCQTWPPTTRAWTQLGMYRNVKDGIKSWRWLYSVKGEPSDNKGDEIV